jgi:uncharacterized protein DUF4397
MSKRLYVGVGALLFGAFALACSDASGNKDETSIRFINASPNGPAMTALLDGAIIEANVTYATPSPYQIVNEDGKTIQLRNAVTDATLFNQDVDLEHERFYTEIATGNSSTLGSLFVQDNRDAPPAGQAFFRFIHVAPTMPAGLDIYVTDPNADISTLSPTIPNVVYLTASSYVQIAGGTYRVRVTATGTKTVLIDDANVGLPALGARTMLSLDNPGGGPPFSTLLLTDQS